VSKYSKLTSWVDREFPAPIAREYHKRHWKWRRGLKGEHVGPFTPKRPYVWRTAYRWALRRAGRIDDLARFEAGFAAALPTPEQPA
jgi:hypothetical protein